MRRLLLVLICSAGISAMACSRRSVTMPPPAKPTASLTHEQTLEWIERHSAWRPARKLKPIWARPLAEEEMGREFQTADHAVEKGKPGALLCVGVAGEPWFQAAEKVRAKYEVGEEETRQFNFDTKPRAYRVYRPLPDSRVLAAQVKSEGIKEFSIRPGYDPTITLRSPAGGYVVRNYTADPTTRPSDVWLVQKELFESTYEFVSEEKQSR
jgi:hypothetical protein